MRPRSLATSTRCSRILLALLIGCSLLVAPAVATTGDAVSQPAEAFQVTLDEDGDVEVQLRLTFDLDDDSEQAAFEEYQDDENATRELRERFADRMNRIATRSAAVTDREMRVVDPEATFNSTDTTGIVTLSVTWEGMAAVDDDRLVVTEPFASGFEPSERFVLVGPEDYSIASATPSADQQDDRTAVWAAGTDLSGFNTTFQPEPAASTDDATPGFGIIVAVGGIVGGVALVARE